MSTTKDFFTLVHSVDSAPENTLVIVGTANDGPANTPFRITSQVDPFSKLGYTPLAIAYDSARSASNNIILYRLNGEHATSTVTYSYTDTGASETYTVDVFKFTSVSANDSYNDISASFDGEKMKVVNSDGTVRNYYYADYPNAYLLADAINIDAEYGLLEFTAEVLQPDFLMSKFGNSIFNAIFTGGLTEENLSQDRAFVSDMSSTISTLKGRLNTALFGANTDDQANYEPAGDLAYLDFGVIVLADLFHDDDAELAKILGNFCLNKTLRMGQGCIGVLGTKPIYDVTDAAKSDKLASLLAIAPMNLSKSPGGTGQEGQGQSAIEDITYRSHIQLVVGETNKSLTIGAVSRPVSLAYIYAATQTNNLYYVSMTNKALAGISSLNYEFKKKDVEQLLSNGYISIVSSIRKGYVSYYSATADGPGTRFSNPSTIRITHQISRTVINGIDDYIGMNTNPVMRRSLQGRVAQIMDQFISSGVIKDYTLQYEFSNRYREVQITISVLPFSEVRYVNATVSLPYTGTVV